MLDVSTGRGNNLRTVYIRLIVPMPGAYLKNTGGNYSGAASITGAGARFQSILRDRLSINVPRPQREDGIVARPHLCGSGAQDTQ